MGKMEEQFLHQQSDMLFQKAKELSKLCNLDIGVILFSPIGEVNEFGSGESLEDVYLKLLDQSPEIRGQIKDLKKVTEGLNKLKKERRLMNKVTKIQELWEEAINVNQSHQAMKKRLSLYDPKIEDMKSLEEVHESEHLIAQAIQKIHEMRSSKLTMNVKLEIGESSNMKTGETPLEHVSSPEIKRRFVVKDDHNGQAEKRKPSSSEFQAQKRGVDS